MLASEVGMLLIMQGEGFTYGGHIIAGKGYVVQIAVGCWWCCVVVLGLLPDHTAAAR